MDIDNTCIYINIDLILVLMHFSLPRSTRSKSQSPSPAFSNHLNSHLVERPSAFSLSNQESNLQAEDKIRKMSSNNPPNPPNTENNSAWARLRPRSLSSFGREIQQMTALEILRLMDDMVSQDETSDEIFRHQMDRLDLAIDRLGTAVDPHLRMPEDGSSTPEAVDLVLSPLPIDDFPDADIPAPHAGAGTKFIEQLPDINLKDFPNELDCHICMEPFKNADENPVQLPCGHILGRNCISKWLETSTTCPLCRHVLFKQTPDHLPVRIFHTADGRPFRHFREPFAEVDIGTVLQRAGLSVEEAVSFQEDWSDICWQQASLEVRLVGLEMGERPLPMRIAAELEALVEDANGLAVRLGGFWERWREVIEAHRIRLPGVGAFDVEGALGGLDV